MSLCRPFPLYRRCRLRSPRPETGTAIGRHDGRRTPRKPPSGRGTAALTGRKPRRDNIRNIFESGACRCKRRSLLYNSEMSGKRSVFFNTDAKSPDELIPPTHLTAGTQNVSYVSLSIPTKRREAAPAGGEMPHIHRLSSRALPAFRIRFCDPAYRSRHHISPTDLRFV